MKRIVVILTAMLLLCSCSEIERQKAERKVNMQSTATRRYDNPCNIDNMEFAIKEYNGHQYVICAAKEIGAYADAVSVSIVHSPDCPCHNDNEHDMKSTDILSH